MTTKIDNIHNSLLQCVYTWCDNSVGGGCWSEAR